MGYFVGRSAGYDGSEVTWNYYHTRQEALEAVEKRGGYIVKTLEVSAKEDKSA